MGIKSPSLSHKSEGPEVSRYMEYTPYNTASGAFAIHAIEMQRNGFSPIPVAPQGKKPLILDWPAYGQNPPCQRQVENWWFPRGNAGVGHVGGRTLNADIDTPCIEARDAVESVVSAVLGMTPFRRIGNPDRSLLVYRCEKPIPTHSVVLAWKGEEFKVQFLGNGSHSVFYGLHEDTKAPYRWGDAEPATTPLTAATLVDEAALAALWDVLSMRFPPIGERQQNPYRITVIHHLPAPANDTGELAPIIRPVRRDGQLVDGREDHLKKLVLNACHAHRRLPIEEIARIVYAQFQRDCDLTQGRSGGRGSKYNFTEILGRVRRTLKKVVEGRLARSPAKILKASARTPAIDCAGLTAFSLYIDGMAGEHRISPSGYRVHQFMLDRMHDGRLFNDTASFIARGTGLSLPSVKRARKELRDCGYWSTKELPSITRSPYRRDTSAPYFPNPKALAQAAALYESKGKGTLQEDTAQAIDITAQWLDPVSINNGDLIPNTSFVPGVVRGEGTQQPPRKTRASAVASRTGVKGKTAPRQGALDLKHEQPVTAQERRPATLQASLLGRLVGSREPIVREVYSGGIMSEAMVERVRDALTAANMLNGDLASKIGANRTTLVNALQRRFGLSGEKAAPLMAWLGQVENDPFLTSKGQGAA